MNPVGSGVVLLDAEASHPKKRDIYVWEPDRPDFRSVIIVTQVTRHMIRARRVAGGRTFWNPLDIFLNSCRLALPEEIAP